MKFRRSSRTAPGRSSRSTTTLGAVALATGAILSPASAATQTLSVSGAWDTTSPIWNGATSWTNGNDAVFAAAATTIEIAGDIQVSGISSALDVTFNDSVPGGTLTFLAPATLSGGGDLTFNTLVSGSSGLTVNNPGGIVALNAENSTLTGPVSVLGGTLQLGPAGAINAINSLAIATGAAVTSSNINQIGNVAVTNAGTLSLGGNDNVLSYVSTGGTFNGPGTLTSVSGYTLNTGTTVNGNLGNGVITANGTVALNGNTSANGALAVQSGTTTVAGNLGATTVAVSDAATLATTATGNLADTAALNLNTSGALQLGASDTVGRLTGSGGTVALGTHTLTLANGASATSGAVISGPGGLALSSGTQTLSGASTYAGPTNVNGGTLALTGSLTSTAVNVASGAALTTTGGLADGTFLALTGTAATTFTAAETLASLSGAGTVSATDLTVGTLTSSAAITSSGTVTASFGSFTGDILTGNLVKTSGGTLTLNTPLTTAGSVNVVVGTLALAHATDTLNDASALTVQPGATVSLTGTDTVASFTSAGGTLSGPGTLTAATYALNSGTTVNANLGAGTLTANGLVTLAGTAAAETVTVTGGTLALAPTGALSGATSLSVSAGATLTTSAANQLADTAAVSNQGVLAVNGTDTVASFTNSGTLSGTGTLTTADGLYTLATGSTVSGNLGVGTVNVTGPTTFAGGTSAASAVNITAGSLTLSGNNLATSATVTNSASLVVNGSDTIGALVNTGSVSGAGILTAATYTLDTGSTVSGHLGLGTVNVIGTTSVTGLIDTLTVNVADGIALELSGNNLANASTLTLGTAGTITLLGNETVGTFVNNAGSLGGFGILTAADYFLNTGTTVTAGLGDGNITTNGTVSIQGATGAGVFTVATGTTTLASFTGATAVTVAADASLLLGNDAEINAATTVSVATGATLSTGGVNQIGNATVTNSGTLNLGGTDAVAAYVSTGGTFNGPGTLTAATYTLNDGTVANGNLGAGAYTANGTVLINGTTGAGSFLVQSGQTTHNNTAATTALTVTGGELVLGSAASFNAATTIAISGPGTVTLGNSNQLGETAALTSAGTLDLGTHSDTVASFVSDGGLLSGTGTLTAATYALNTGTTIDANLGTGTLTANGLVAINGDTAASAFTVQSGTTTLAGASSATTVQVDTAAALTTTPTGTLADTAAVTLVGTAALTLGQSDTIANLSGAGTVALGENTLTLSDGAGASSAAVISGTGGLTLTTGTQTLSGASTYTGATNVNGGTLALTGSLLGTEVNVASGAALTTTGGLADATDLTLTGTASATFTGAETLASLSGAGTVDAIDLTVGTLTGTATINSSGLVTVSDGLFSGNLATGALDKVTPGTLTLTTTQSYTGGTTVTAGTLVLAHATDTLADTGALTALTGTTVDIQANTDTVATATLGGALIGTGTLTATSYALTAGAVIDANLGTGTLTADGIVAINGDTAASDFTVQTGTTTLAGASAATTVQVNDAAALITTATGTLADTAAVTLTGTAALTLGQSETIANLSGAGTIALGEHTLTLSDGAGASSAAAISGTGGLVLTSGTQTLSGVSTYTGDTVVNGGNLIIDGSNQSASLLVNAGLLNLNATSAAATVDIATGATLTTGAAERLNNNVIIENDGTLNLGGNETLGALFGTGTVNLGANNLTFAGDGDVNPGELISDFSGTIIGSGTLTKNGDDIQVLSGANTYSGIAFVNDGVLRVTHGEALGLSGANGRTNVAPGGTLQLANNITLAESIRISGLGFDGLGTINNLSGDNTITGQLGIVGGQPDTVIRAEAGTLAFTGDILRTVYTVGDPVAAVPRLSFHAETDATITLSGGNGFFYFSSIGDIAKTGSGTLDLVGLTGNQSTGDLRIDDGTVRISREDRLGGSSVIFGVSDTGIFRTAATSLQTAIAPGAGELVTGGDGTFADFRNTVFNFAAGHGTIFTEADTALRLSNLVNFDTSTLIKDGTADLLLDLRGGGDAKFLPALAVNTGTIFFIAEDTASLTLDGLGDGGPGNGLVNFGALDVVINQDFASTFTGDLTGTGDLTVNALSSAILDISGALSGFSSVSIGGDMTGIVELSGPSTYTGPTTVLSGGFLALSGTLQTASVAVSTGSNLELLASNRLLDTATVTNSGTFDLGTFSETVASFASTGGTLDGTGTLTAATYALNNGTTINANLGTGTLTANGTVAINGNTAASAFTVQSGVTTLAGASSATTVQLDSGATLITTATGTLDDTATVTLDGVSVLTLGQSETIGRLAGTGGGINLGATTLTLSDGQGASSAASLNGTGGLTLLTGTQTLSGASTYSGATNVNGGTLALTGSLTGTEVNVADGAALTTTGGLADDTDLTLTGTASATFTAAETLDTLNGAGTVSATDLTVTTVTSSATINSSGLVTISDGLFSGDLVTGALTKVTAGTLTLSGENATSGPITVDGGTLVLAHATNTLADNAALIANTGTTVDIQGNTDTVGTLELNDADLNGTGTLTATTYALNNGTVTNANLGTGTLTANGTVAINGNTAASAFTVQTGTTTLAGASAATTVQIDTAGTLVTTATGTLADTATVTLDGASVLTLGQSDTIGRLAGTGGTINLGATTLTLSDGQGASSAAVITGTGGVTLTTGTQTLSGASTYTGATNVNGGTLALTGSLLGTEVNVADGAALTTTGGLAADTDLTLTGTASATFTAAETLDTLNGAGTVTATDLTVTTVASSATINSSGLVTISDGLFSGDLVTGALTKVTAGTLTLSGTNATPGPITVNGGTLVLAHATNTLADNADLIANPGTTVDIQGNTDTIGTLEFNDATLSGTGTLTAATYALNDGTVIDANLGTGTLTANGTVAINGNTDASVFTVQTGTTTLAGASAATTVQIDTAGTLVTTATGTLADTATVTLDGASVLTLGQSDTIGRLAGTGGTINLGATTLTLSDGQGASSAAVITGTGGVTLTTGTQTLSGASTYTGVTTVTGGILNLDGTTQSATLAVQSGARLNLNAAAAAQNLTVAQDGILATGAAEVISDTAAVTLAGLAPNAGRFILGGNETIGFLNSALSTAGRVELAGFTLTIAQGGDFNGSVSGVGTLRVAPTAAPTIINNPTTSDSTIANEATLVLNADLNAPAYVSSGGTLDGASRLTAATYVFNDGVNGISVVRANLGDGVATINGTLRASSELGNAATPGDLEVTVSPGGFLRGLSGDIDRAFTINGNLTIADGGRLAPGASPGITVLTGDWLHNGTFETELAGLGGAGVANGHDQIQVGGVITLGATSVLDIQRDGVFTEPARGDLFRVIVGDLTDQRFATVVTEFSTGLVLDLEDGTLIGTGLPVLNAAGAVDLTALPGLDANTIAIVGAFQQQAFAADANGVQMNSTNNSPFGTPAAQGIRALLTTPLGNANGIQAASPESFAAESAYAVRATRHYTDTALNAPALAHAGDFSLFAAYSGHSAETDSSIAAGDYELSGSGALAGARMPVGDSAVIGVFAAFDEGDISSRHRDADVSGQVYGLVGEVAVGERTALTASVASANYESDSSRTSLFGGQARARGIDTEALHLSVGLRHDLVKEKDRGFSPYLEFRYTDASTDTFEEAAPTFDRLAVEGIDYTSFEGELGARGYIMVTEKFGFNGQLAVAQEFGDDDTDVDARLANGGVPFTVNSRGFGETSVTAGIGFTYDATDRLRLGAGVKAGLVTDSDTTVNYHLGGSFRF